MYYCPNCTAPLATQTPHCPFCGTSLGTTATSNTRNFAAVQDDQLRVDDLLYGSQPYPRADFGRRFVAYLIDSVIFGFLFVPFIVLSSLTDHNEGEMGGGTAIGILLSVLIPFAYFLTKDGLFHGRSVGKLAVGLMTVDVTQHMPCNVGKSIARNLLGGILACVPLGGLVDMVMMLTDAEGRRVGDRACKTQVIPVSTYRTI